MTEFLHIGDPVPWSRPRFGKKGGFNTAEHTAGKSDLAWRLKKWWSKPCIPMPTPIAVDINFVFKSSKKKLFGSYKPTRSDIDNHIKMVLDAGNGVLWQDDSQVAVISATKTYGERGSTQVCIQILQDPVETSL